MFYFWDWTMLILIPGIIISAIAQAKVSSAYSRYSEVRTANGLTGAEASREIMNDSGLRGVQIVQIGGKLTDNYNPKTKMMSLSQGVCNQATVAAVGIAAHETGHALQDMDGYAPMKFRNAIVPVCGFASNASWPLFILGFFFGNSSFGITLMDIGIGLFCVALVFYLITLPVEFNASKRAMQALDQYGLVTEEELVGVKRVLNAAALTYVASMLAALLNLVRLLALRGSRN
ncbi:MAG: zinc metallopeptidase [Eubacteriaceae bacterium]|jgi:Zn-dependent membrane protease YugP